MGFRILPREEISKRFAASMATMTKLDLFWRHSNCPTRVKVYTADAVLRSKLLYGLESAQPIPSVLKKIDLVWRHSNCPTHAKVYTADAVLRSKLLYGLESAQLIPSVLKN